MNRLKPHLEGIIFDMDGTIINTEAVWVEATYDLLDAYGVPRTKLITEHSDVLDQMVGIGLFGSAQLMIDSFKIANVTPKELAEGLLLRANARFKEEIKFIHGFEEFHRKLTAAGIPSGIATNCDAITLQNLVQKMNFNTYFGQNIYSIADVDNKAKPDPAVFLHTAEKLGAQPEKCIVFEDSLWGFIAAKAANMRCVAVKNKTNQVFYEEHTHGGIESYSAAEVEIIRIVERYLRTELKQKGQILEVPLKSSLE